MTNKQEKTTTLQRNRKTKKAKKKKKKKKKKIDPKLHNAKKVYFHTFFILH